MHSKSAIYSFAYFALLHLSIILFYLEIAICVAFSHNEEAKAFPIKAEIIDTGQCGHDRNFSFSTNENHDHCIRFYGEALSSLLPQRFAGASRGAIFKVHQKNCDFLDRSNFEILSRDKNWKLTRVDQSIENRFFGEDRRESSSSNSTLIVNFYTGHIVDQKAFTTSSHSTANLQLFGNLDRSRSSRSISFYAFIRFRDIVLHIRPNITANDAFENTGKNIPHLIVSIIRSDILPYSFSRQFTTDRKCHSRKTRSSEMQKSCPIILYVDYSFYRKMSHDIGRTILLINYLFAFTNDIFMNTEFTATGRPNRRAEEARTTKMDRSYRGYRNMLCKVIVQREPPDYLQEPIPVEAWTENALHDFLSGLENRESYCLAYLFTDRRIAGAGNADWNGLAQPKAIFSNDDRVPNIGAVSFHNCRDPFSPYCALIFAHELGHSWGATHDADSEECLPAKNGSYIMSMPFLYAYGPNNFQYSPCAKRAIFMGIVAVSPHSFRANCEQCGNAIVESGEECDEGAFSGNCCSAQCKLLESRNARCSAYNHDCCDERCQIRTAGFVCRDAAREHCRHESRCDGSRSICPAAESIPDGTRCSHAGICRAGYCDSSCPAGSVECDCADRAPCHACCRRIASIIFVDENSADYKDAKDYDYDENRNHNRSIIATSSSDEEDKCLPRFALPDRTPCTIAAESLPGKCEAGSCTPLEIEIANPADDPSEDRRKPRQYPVPPKLHWTFWVVLSLVLIISAIILFSLYATRQYWKGNFFETYLNDTEKANETKSAAAAKVVIMITTNDNDNEDEDEDEDEDDNASNNDIYHDAIEDQNDGKNRHQKSNGNNLSEK